MKLLHVFFIIQCTSLHTPKYCVNCKYFKSQLFQTEFGKCVLFPKIKKDEKFLVTGKVKKEVVDYQYCSVVREYECGKEGKLYIDKNAKKS